MPTVSVIIPTFNRPWGLRRAVASVLAQSFDDFELVVVDDCSTDGTLEVAKSFTDPRVRYHRQRRNVGVAQNWGTGVGLARGEFLALLMDDDRYEADFLSRRIRALQAYPEATFAFAGYRVVTEDGRETKVHAPAFPAGKVLTDDVLLGALLAQDNFVGATLYRAVRLREVWASAEMAGIVVDHAANIRLGLVTGAAAVFVGGTDFIQAEHPGQMSYARAEQVFDETLKLYGGLLSESLAPRARRAIRHQAAFWLVQGARGAAARGDRWTAARRLTYAVSLHPLWAGPWTQLVRTLLGPRPPV